MIVGCAEAKLTSPQNTEYAVPPLACTVPDDPPVVKDWPLMLSGTPPHETTIPAAVVENDDVVTDGAFVPVDPGADTSNVADPAPAREYDRRKAISVPKGPLARLHVAVVDPEVGLRA